MMDKYWYFHPESDCYFIESEDYSDDFSFQLSKAIYQDEQERRTVKVRHRINQRLGYGFVKIDTILANTDAIVFGGAVRDALADLEINDIDIICFSESAKKILGYFERFGFKKAEGSEEIKEMYSDDEMLFRPISVEVDKATVQLIRPAINFDKHNHSRQQIKRSDVFDFAMEFISNVDMSCCGVAYDLSGFYELVPNATRHCEARRFRMLPDNKLHEPGRAERRKQKLIDRGWKELKIL